MTEIIGKMCNVTGYMLWSLAPADKEGSSLTQYCLGEPFNLKANRGLIVDEERSVGSEI